MFKRFLLSAALVAGLVSLAEAAGTITLSMTQQIDKDSLKPLAGGKLYFYSAGTTTPQIAYQDTALTIPVPGGAVITLDAAGRIPQFFLADGQIKFRLTNAKGVQQLAADGILVIGPSSGGGGGGGSVDPTTVAATGDMKCKYTNTTLAGWVRTNARTIGSASSGASERANADAQTLFEYLWNNDPNLAVSTGRGASSLADWTANKTIALPDSRGRVIASLDDMGNTAAGRLTATYFNASGLGVSGGSQSTQLLSAANLPPHTHSGTTSLQTADHSHVVPDGLNKNAFAVTAASGSSGSGGYWNGSTSANSGVQSASHAHNFTTDNGSGSSTPFGTMPPTLLVSCFIKL